MARTNRIYSNFSSGEFSPDLFAHVDLLKYNNGLEILENFDVLRRGGSTRRTGSVFVAEVKDSLKKVRTIPFQFNVTQAYVMEFGDLYVRFYTYDGSNNPIQLDSGGPVEIVTPYLEAELYELKFVQSADVLYVVHENHEPAKIQRTSATSFTFTEVDFFDGPYIPINEDITDTLTLTGGAPWGVGATLTMTAVGHTPFLAAHVGSLWRLQNDAAGTDVTFVKVTAFTSTTVVTVEVQSPVPASLQAVATSFWLEGAWSNVKGFPRAIIFHEQRLVFGGSNFQPQTIWGSVSQDFEDMTAGVNDDDAYLFTIASDKVNVIQWLSSVDKLIIGTAGSEFRVGSTGPAITPSDIDVKRQTSFGSGRTRILQIDGITLFTQRAGRKLYTYDFVFQIDRYDGNDISLLSDQATESGILDVDYEQEVEPHILLLRNDGQIAVVTYLPKQNIFAFSRRLAGASSAGAAVYEGVAVIPNATGTADGVWVSVKRTIDGATKRYIEYFDDQFGDALQMDSALSFDGALTDTLSGLEHLEGETVDIVFKDIASEDFGVHPQKTVSGGSITLDLEVTEAIVGLHYDSTLKTVRVEGGSELGSSQGLPKSFANTVVRVKDSLGMTVNDQFIDFLKGDDIMDQPPPRFTGDKEISNTGWDKEGQITIKQTQPLPLTILGIAAILNVGEG